MSLTVTDPNEVAMVAGARAQPADYIKITPPSGMRWKTLNQSAVTNDITFVDKNGDTYALDVLSVIESTLDDPRQILSAQQFRARGEAVAAMKADGIEYEERMELLDSVTYPKPLEDLLEAAYEIYRRGHPWVGDYMVSPKTVVRDMFERAMTFGEYVQFYSLSRSEGIVLRYLADAYKAALARTK